jgi:membrane protease YdiL (CAAX protease family)
MEILLTAGALAIALGSRWALLDWLRKDVPKPELNLLPSNWGELPFWIVISVLAGVAEELTYRGVLFTILKEATHSILAGACLSAAAFALAHLSQGWRATAFIFGLALLFQAMTLNSGNLYSAMIVHAVYDFVVGVLVIRERLRNPKPPGEHEGAEPGLPIK